MKKFIALIAAALVMGSVTFAEGGIEVGAKIGFGPTAGTQFEGIPTKAVCAFDFGFFGHFELADVGIGTFAIQPELDFTFGNGGRTYGIGWETKIKFASMDIPVLVSYDMQLGPINLRPFTGLQMAFPLGKYRVDGEKTEAKAKGFLFGMVFGCGISYPIGPVLLNGDIRYNVDFTKFKTEDGEKFGRRGSLIFNFGAAYKF